MGSELTVKSDWYSSMLDECVAAVTEYSFMSRWSKIEGYWNLGKIINGQHDNFIREKIYGERIIQNISKDLGMSTRTLHYAVKFHKKFPDLNKLPVGKNVNWTMVVNNLLPEYKLPKEEHEEASHTHVCPHCGWGWD